jgi:hypothetical protein
MQKNRFDARGRGAQRLYQPVSVHNRLESVEYGYDIRVLQPPQQSDLPQRAQCLRVVLAQLVFGHALDGDIDAAGCVEGFNNSAVHASSQYAL